MNSKYKRKSIGGKNLWIRKCPNCGVEILYNTSENTSRAEKNKNECKSCKYQKLKINWYENHPKKIDKNYLVRTCASCKKTIIYKNRRCKKKAERHNSLCRMCSRKNVKFGPMSEEHKRKISIKHIERLKRIGGKIRPNYNPNACLIFEKLNKDNGWELSHALNGGEKRILNYYVDAYDEKRNIIIEYDESHHYNIYGQLKDDDINRMEDIINYSHCQFYRYKESENKLYKITKDLTYEERYEIVKT